VARRVAVVDYGVGNLDSVERALDECGARPTVTADAGEIERADAIVVPGVGAFARGMAGLRSRGLDEVLTERARAQGVPLLGLCLGMQLLAAGSDESPGVPGLGWFDAAVRRLTSNGDLERVPHVGWNELRIERDCHLLANIPSGTDFYFVHSYYVDCADEGDVIATTPYCTGFPSVIGRGNVWGVQFHPEKSQRAGFRLLQNFLEI